VSRSAIMSPSRVSMPTEASAKMIVFCAACRQTGNYSPLCVSVTHG
jgi:hypothetical protein